MPGLWICLIITHVRYAFEDASGSKCVRVLNMARLEFWSCLKLAQYATIMPEYTLICLNVPQYARAHLNIDLNKAEYSWMSLNISENPWINCSNYAGVLYMPHFLRYLTVFEYIPPALKVLYSDKLSGDGQIFQVWPYLNSLIKIKLPFSQQEHLQIFPTSLAKSNTCPSLRFLVRERPGTFFLL